MVDALRKCIMKILFFRYYLDTIYYVKLTVNYNLKLKRSFYQWIFIFVDIHLLLIWHFIFNELSHSFKNISIHRPLIHLSVNVISLLSDNINLRKKKFAIYIIILVTISVIPLNDSKITIRHICKMAWTFFGKKNQKLPFQCTISIEFITGE